MVHIAPTNLFSYGTYYSHPLLHEKKERPHVNLVHKFVDYPRKFGTLDLLKIISFRSFHIVQRLAQTLTQIRALTIGLVPLSQFSNILVTLARDGTIKVK
jgi:hypothetical protein